MEVMRIASAPGTITTKKRRQRKQLISKLQILYNDLIQRCIEQTSRSSLTAATLTLKHIIINLYVIVYFNAIVKTDKVVMTKPPSIESYDGIINSYTDVVVLLSRMC